MMVITATVLILSVNWGVETLCDEVPQVSQWEATCERGAIGILLLMAGMMTERADKTREIVAL